VLLAVGWVMRGTPQATEVIILIGGGVAVTFALLGGSRRSTRASKL